VGNIIVRNNRKKVIYCVQSIKDINNVIIPYFNKYSLLTQKNVDFELFVSIIDLMNNREHLNLKGIFKILTIKATLNKGLSRELEKAFPNIRKNKRRVYFPKQIEDPQ
jgi:hypothetical protein